MGSASAQAMFFGKLAALLKANLPLLKAMEVSLERVEEGKLRDAFSRILDRAYQGSSLTDAFFLEKDVFATEVLTLIANGEETGELEIRVQALAEGLAAGTFQARPEDGDGSPPLERLAGEAVSTGATDIHVTPSADGAEVRFRIGGKLVLREELRTADLADFVERAHLLSGLPAVPARAPCFGEFEAAGMHVMASFVPVPEGESLVLRLTAPQALMPELADFGFSETQVATLSEWTGKPHGMLLVAGLPGSGREKLLRSLLATIDYKSTRGFSVTAGPTPRIEGVSRIIADELSRASALRVAMGQDLDSVMIDELESGETAITAARVARTGHLVLAGIRAREATGALAGLLDLGLDPEDVAELVIGVAVLRAGTAGNEVFVVDREACREILDQE